MLLQLSVVNAYIEVAKLSIVLRLCLNVDKTPTLSTYTQVYIPMYSQDAKLCI